MIVVDFGYADLSTEEALYPIWTEKDINNGPSEYVCIFNFNGKNYIVTKRMDKNKEKLLVNEITCDYRASINDIVFYYPKKKNTECINFEKIFNISPLKERLLSGQMDISTIIKIFEDLKFGTINISPIDKLFLSMLRKEKNDDECIELFGLKKGLFDALREHNMQNVSSFNNQNKKRR